MLLKSASIQNFRSLVDVEVKIDPLTTLVVGRNNTGKTSFVDLFCKFFGSRDARFVLEDFSTQRIADLREAIDLYAESESGRAQGDGEAAKGLLDRAIGKLPVIRLTLTIGYDESDDLAALADVILDLDENCYEAVVEATVEVAKPLEFFARYLAERQSADIAIDKYLERGFQRVFAVRYFAVDARRASHRKEVSRAVIDRIFCAKFVYAQNKFDDSSTDRTNNLSRTFETYYKTNSGDLGNENVETIDKALATVSVQLDENYEKLFRPIFDDLNSFGLDTITPVQKLRIVSLLEADEILRDSTRIRYPSGEDDYLLPEGHNGLGYTKLIFTILQVVGFYENYKRLSPQPGFQILFIEEPEAHLHPQMQEAFIKNIRDFIEGKTGWNVQVVITTHSSHIVTSSGFDGIRYFACTGEGLKVKDLCRFKESILPSKDGSTPDGSETYRFLFQYMVLHRCDMFFADMVIMIEGAVERLLLPEMIAKSAPSLKHRYVSVIEVGGAYADKFKELLEFIGVATLIITDIDSVDAADKRRRCPTAHEGAVSSNATIKNWLPGESEIAKLVALNVDRKIKGRVRVAYQQPEEEGGPCGRSFEEAFIIANAEKLSQDANKLALGKVFTAKDGTVFSPDAIRAASYEIADALDKKTDFAFDVMRLGGWRTPLYIEEGLEWLSATL
ncbi:AAA family ATPase [Lentzea sp. NEAU-D13]|uniref:AAA family ATPase n=1 Tax=Lentzea alba TaxID=2714351 RepID=A0A7C9W5C5_9PSEU|nr:AAA family ATPase [Lentzea alba]